MKKKIKEWICKMIGHKFHLETADFVFCNLHYITCLRCGKHIT